MSLLCGQHFDKQEKIFWISRFFHFNRPVFLNWWVESQLPKTGKNNKKYIIIKRFNVRLYFESFWQMQFMERVHECCPDSISVVRWDVVRLCLYSFIKKSLSPHFLSDIMLCSRQANATARTVYHFTKALKRLWACNVWNNSKLPINHVTNA